MMIRMMQARRPISVTRRRSSLAETDMPDIQNHSGRMIWLDIIVETASAATITIAVAEENPPRKASSARLSCPCDSGTVSTKRSGLAVGGRLDSPNSAIGTMKRHMASRYVGNAQEATASC